MEIEKVLEERGKRYGSFEGHAAKARVLKRIWQASNGAHIAGSDDKVVDAVIQEGMDMIMHKLARIMNGDPYYADSWTDIAGYAQLVANHLNNWAKSFESTIELNGQGREL